jgi:hypothetical protein
MKNLQILFSIILILTFTQCGQTPKESTANEDAETSQGIRLTKAPASVAYPDASLSLKSFASEKSGNAYSANFEFEVSNYELGVQTEGSDTRGIANSGKGQHIHLILNNGPYSAHYEPTVTKQLEEGNYVALAFLSRSFHESVKNATSYWIDVITVGEPEDQLSIDFTAPHMLYSRPKGTYKGKDTEKLMIDFFLLNTTLAPDGNKVRATVNGEVFLIDEWAPFYVEGLPLGEVSIKLELLDANGNVIPGPFNTVERKVTLAPAETE